ncbi:MAG: FAD-binding protein [Lachnospiraceae bacterium]|nr:FAD-binding protein [Lachnospiraceae bacterium]
MADLEKFNRKVNIIGAGLAGLSAAIHLAKEGVASRLISLQPSERAQSVMAEGGINAAIDTMGEDDNVENHYKDTIKGGVYLANKEAVRGLAEGAPSIVRWLQSLGAPFNMQKGEIILRNFGGQAKKRTAYAKSSTGKILMSTLIDEARKYEAEGLIKRYPHHDFTSLIIENEKCLGVEIRDLYTGNKGKLYGAVILCTGAMNSLFPGLTTGTTVNTGDVTATAFRQGVKIANPEFIQYHPTTVPITGKRMLISEAARGEGGRLFVFEADCEKAECDKKTELKKKDEESRYYFMEDLFPEFGNLMPRDVVSRQMAGIGKPVYLDMTGIGKDIWEDRLSDLREECIRLLGKDPKKDYIEVSPGIHYFMGGIYVDKSHKSSMEGLFAAGECACQYHGANRLGGNSMLGAIYGGKVAAESAARFAAGLSHKKSEWVEVNKEEPLYDYGISKEAATVLRQALGIFRDEAGLKGALEKIDLMEKNEKDEREKSRLVLAKAMLMAALERKESRGAHTRVDYPKASDEYLKTSVLKYENGEIKHSLEDID